MSTGSKIKQAIKYFNAAFSDETLTNNVVSVVGDVLSNKFPDDSPLGVMYTIGEVRVINGFYVDEWLINDMCASMIGRAVRHCCLLAEVDLDNPNVVGRMVDFLHSTDATQGRIVPKIIQQCIEKYGNPSTVDTAALLVIKKRYGFDKLN